jgi:hypothetical protein
MNLVVQSLTGKQAQRPFPPFKKDCRNNKGTAKCYADAGQNSSTRHFFISARAAWHAIDDTVPVSTIYGEVLVVYMASNRVSVGYPDRLSGMAG